MTIVRRELLDHLQSVQFIALLAVSLVLFAFSAVSFVKSYPQDRAFYAQKAAETEKNLSTVSTRLFRAPSPMRFIADGGDRYRPAAYQLGTMGYLSPLPSRPSNLRLPEVPEIDWSFIVKVIFSLYAVLLGFDAVAGEKESGTLRLILSNPIRRGHLLASKYAAILLTILIPLFAGLLLSLVIIGIFEPQVLTPVHFLRVATAAALMVAYISVFTLLSLARSALIHRSSLVLLVLLGAWVSLAVIVPNVSGILSQVAARVPSEYELAKMVDPMIKQQVWGRIQSIQDRVTKGAITTEEQILEEAHRAYEEGAKALAEHYDNYGRAMREREATAQRWSRISPTALLGYALEAMAMTGTRAEEGFRRDALNYSRVYDAYVGQKVGKLVRSSGYRFGTGVIFNGRYLDISSPIPPEYPGDKSDFPRLSQAPPSFFQALRIALGDLAGLLVWNVALAIVAFWAMVRMDVR